MANSKEEKALQEEKILKKSQNRRVHLANERTFLAWIRTSIAIMAFGFIVEKFALFLRQMYLLMGKTPPPSTTKEALSYLGISLIILGALMGFLAFLRFKKVEKEIDEGTYRPSHLLDLLLLLSLIALAIFLVIYMIHSLAE